METLKYSQNKLLLRVLGSGAACAGALYLFSNQQIADDLPMPLDMFGGDIGHFIVSPFVTASSAVFAWLAASRLISGRNAVECLADEVRVTTFWGRTRIRWADLGHVYIEKKRKRFQTRHRLVFHFVGKGLLGSARVRLPLDATELHANRFEEFREVILTAKRAAGDGSVAAAPIASGSRDVEDGSFDPDAALARYLARKAAEAPQAAPAPIAPAARPTFGRKGL